MENSPHIAKAGGVESEPHLSGIFSVGTPPTREVSSGSNDWVEEFVEFHRVGRQCCFGRRRGPAVETTC